MTPCLYVLGSAEAPADAMSFDNMKRSNNRHNFIARKDHGQLQSQSPFFKSEDDVKKARCVHAHVHVCVCICVYVCGM